MIALDGSKIYNWALPFAAGLSEPIELSLDGLVAETQATELRLSPLHHQIHSNNILKHFM